MFRPAWGTPNISAGLTPRLALRAEAVPLCELCEGDNNFQLPTPKPKPLQLAIFIGFNVDLVAVGFSRVKTISSCSCRIVNLSPSRKEYFVVT